MGRYSRYGKLPPVILASGSPRRSELLDGLGVRHIAVPSHVDEDAIRPPSSPSSLHNYPEALARLKADDVCERLVRGEVEGDPLGAMGLSREALSGREEGDLPFIVIGADTVVLGPNNEILHKPKDAEEAAAHLRLLSGSRHGVASGVVMYYRCYREKSCVMTQVRFQDMSERDIAYYIGEYAPFDKAGGYGIQEWIGLACAYEICGSYPAVMGLPTSFVHNVLSEWAENEGWLCREA